MIDQTKMIFKTVKILKAQQWTQFYVMKMKCNKNKLVNSSGKSVQ